MRNSDAEVDRALDALRSRGWPGSGRNARVEHRIKERLMNEHKGLHLSKRVLIGAIAGAAIGGGAVTAGVVHYANQRAIVVTDDGQRFEVELAPDGTGHWVGDDGTELRLEFVPLEGGENQLSVEMTADGDGAATVFVEDEAPADAESTNDADADGEN